MVFWYLQFLQKTNENNLRYHSSQVEFFRSFFGRIEDTIKDISKLTDLKDTIYTKLALMAWLDDKLGPAPSVLVIIAKTF